MTRKGRKKCIQILFGKSIIFLIKGLVINIKQIYLICNINSGKEPKSLKNKGIQNGKKYNHLMFQKFIPQISKGDKRVFIINGKIKISARVRIRVPHHIFI